jgi:hypothetical protein
LDEKNGTGVLADRGYKPNEAKQVFDLLYPLPVEMWTKPETFEALGRYARSKRVAVAELAYFHLLQLSRGARLPAFNAADPVEARRKFAEKIEEMVSKKQFPPEEGKRKKSK